MPCGVRSYIYAERGLAMSGRFDELRREYPQFVYSGYSVSEHEDGLHLSFDFLSPVCASFIRRRGSTEKVLIYSIPPRRTTRREWLSSSVSRRRSATGNAPARLFSESSAAKCPRMTKLFQKALVQRTRRVFLSKRDKDGYRLFCAYRRAGAEKYPAVRRLCFVGD